MYTNSNIISRAPTLARTLIIIAACFFVPPAALTAADTHPPLLYKDIINRLTDMRHLAEPPGPGEKGALASSHSRASRYDAATDTYVKWNANNDSNGIVRSEGDTEVFADIQGPGCIWRIWSATPGEGHVKIYLDGAAEPAVDLPFAAYFDGKNAPFTRPNIVYKTNANGFNNYTPIPFNKSCKIVAEKNWGSFYNITYTTFAPGTRPPTFSRKLTADENAALDEANRRFGACGPASAADIPGADTHTRTLEIKPGAHAPVADLAGSGAIAGLRVQIHNMPADADAQRVLLRQLALSIRWDDAPAPAVWSPLGDFFGGAAGAVPFRTYVSGLTEDGVWYANWHMPYSSRAVVTIENDSPQTVRMTWQITRVPLPKNETSSLLRFHAKWHGDTHEPRPDRAPDWTLLVTEGRGRYVGTQLHIWNPRGGWWGEGDEKFFIDGEKHPSTIGTGTEDYFGYAWSSGRAFVQALHAQPVNENNKGHVSVHRWHVADNVPFNTRFEGAIEKYFTNRKGTFYHAVAYWYLNAGGADPYGATSLTLRAGPWNRHPIYKEPDVIEAERLRLANGREWSNTVRRRAAAALFVAPEIVSGDEFLIWRIDGAPNQRLDLELPVKKPGLYQILGRFITGTEFGKIQFEINGKKIGPSVDTYSPVPSCDYTGSEPIELGTAALASGTQIFSAISAGKNPKSDGHWMALDYIKLVPLPAQKKTPDNK